MYGFASSLTSDSATAPRVGPMWVTVEIRNVSGTTQYAQIPPRTGAFEFTIADQATGKVVQRNLNSTFGLDDVGGPPEGRPISANTSIYLRFRLDRLYRFTGPGVYTVRATTLRVLVNGRHVLLPPSNAITVSVV
jgi:hypothetical protein